MSIAQRHWPPTARTVCSMHGKKRGKSNIEGIETPHRAPPHDSILADFFCPNCLVL
ncbi:MAG: hypothetical protein P4L50_13475 [Anaerolineaceae bacterium]|nr:hypothetical protein [Alphaproteobacteria bacterium]MDR3574868.1 hypothetical protein [Anaerolineaceae bacterium]